MESNGMKIVPYRIKQARISRGMSTIELAQRLDLTRQAISQYELGKNEPSKAVLNELSSILKYNVNFFYKEVLPEEAAESAIFFRSKKTTSIKNYNAAKEKIKIFSEIHMFLKKFICFPAIDLPKIQYPEQEDLIDAKRIEGYATALRQHWGLENSPINNLIGTIEKHGIIVSQMSLGLSKIDGFSIWRKDEPIIFLCEDKGSNVRVRFSGAHELGHLLLHADIFSEEEKNKELNDRLENEANLFAGAFLLPEKTFSKDIYSSSIDHFIQLKSKWKASISTMIYRCETLGLLSPSQIKYLKDQMTIRGFWRREPLDDSMPIEKPVAHKQAIDILFDNNLLDSYTFTEETGLKSSELEDYCFLERGRLTPSLPNNVVFLRST